MFLRRFQETVKKPSREWEKLFTIQISNEELIFIIHEELLQRTKEHFTHHRGEYLKAPPHRGVWFQWSLWICKINPQWDAPTHLTELLSLKGQEYQALARIWIHTRLRILLVGVHIETICWRWIYAYRILLRTRSPYTPRDVHKNVLAVLLVTAPGGSKPSARQHKLWYIYTRENEEITSVLDNAIEAYRHNIDQREAQFICDDRSQNTGYLWGGQVCQSGALAGSTRGQCSSIGVSSWRKCIGLYAYLHICYTFKILWKANDKRKIKIFS